MVDGNGLLINDYTTQAIAPGMNVTTVVTKRETKRDGHKRHTPCDTSSRKERTDCIETNSSSDQGVETKITANVSLDASSELRAGSDMRSPEDAFKADIDSKVLGLVNVAGVLGKSPKDMIDGFAAKLETGGYDASTFQAAARRILGQ